MQLKQALEASVRHLEAAAVGSPRRNAEMLLMFALACDRAHLYAHPERELTGQEWLRYREAVAERARGIPAQYITGHQEFWGLDLIVTPAVLIPRPETEHVVETVLDLARTALVKTELPDSAPMRIVDVGTGSGCIALALATELPAAEVWAMDISGAALEIARANAVRLQLDKRVQFLQSDLFEGLASVEAAADTRLPFDFDFVVSNPPYVGEEEADKVQREVRKFEPKTAVFAGREGLDVISQLIPQAHVRLKPGGWLVMEIGFGQEEKVRALLADWPEVRTIPDLQGIPRVLAARK